MIKELIMDWCDETTHEGVDVNNTHQFIIDPDNNMIRTFIL